MFVQTKFYKLKIGVSFNFLTDNTLKVPGPVCFCVSKVLLKKFEIFLLFY